MPGLEIPGHLQSRTVEYQANGIQVHDTYVGHEPPMIISNTTGTTVSSDSIWNVWNVNYTTTASTSITATNAYNTSDLIWTNWNGIYTTSISYTTSGTSATIGPAIANTAGVSNILIWDNWNQEYTSNGVSFVRNHQETEEQQQARARREEEYRQRIIEDEAKRAAAKKKAEELLRGHLDLEQLKELEERNFFSVFSKDGQRKYRIERGRSRNVRLLDENGRVVRTYCAHPGPAVPDADTMLAQKLLIESDEQAFLRVANVS